MYSPTVSYRIQANWKKYAPEQRLMQFLYNACKIRYPDLDGDDFFHISDEELVTLTSEYVQRLSDLDNCF